jgi:amino acid adenylation domain-containing protein
MHSPISSDHDDSIAIIGMSCILPGGTDSLDAMWQALCGSYDAISEVPPERWNLDSVYDPDPGVPGKTVTRWGGFVKDIEAFDAAFFGISPREASVMDPQQRMLLETSWRALEDAGIPANKLAGSRTGVYIGISHSDYHGIQKYGRHEIDVHTSTGGALSIAANRLSHHFDLRGPSLSIDTACSSSLVALDIACNGLRSGECEMAMVGGVNAMLTPDVTITFSRASMLSPDGRCKAFDSRANGYVRGEGAGLVVLKPLRRALADTDKIHAIIRATAVNQDGHTTTITVPSLQAQISMLREACRRANIDPSQVGYVEAHGTGTPVGDPIEAEAIGTVFGAGRGHRQPCLIGSVKTNVGHLEPAAGVIGLMKAALCVKHGQIPPSLHFRSVNPRIRLDELGIKVCQQLTPFPEPGPRIAAVNSFGFGGTNACAIVQEPPPAVRSDKRPRESLRPLLLPLSAATKKGLETQASRLAELLTSEINLADAAGTLALRRSHLDYRAAVRAGSAHEAARGLGAVAKAEAAEGVVYGRRGDRRRTAFVFTGQGAQWLGMGRGLLERNEVFRSAVECCDAIFCRLSGWSLLEEMLAPQQSSRMDQTIVAQPTTFALQVGLGAVWKHWGVTPAAVIGHSIGEMAAAYTAGALSLEAALRVVYHRSRLQERTRFQGGMAAVGLPAEEAARLLHEQQFALEVAAINSAELVTIAGDKAELDRLLAYLQTERSGIFARQLQVDYAFHTRQMDPFRDELKRNLEGLVSHSSEVAMISTVTGAVVQAGELGADYWCRNMREPVLFHRAVEAAIADGFNTFIELGAHPVLTGPVRSSLAARGAKSSVVVASLEREKREEHSLAAALSELYVTGVDLEWRNIVPQDWTFIELPAHPFDKSAFWSESEEARSARFDRPAHPLLGFRLKIGAPRWQAHIAADAPRYMGDHCVDGTPVFPAAGYVELCLAAAREVLGPGVWELESIAFHDALVLPTSGVVIVETSLSAETGRIEIQSRLRGQEEDWTRRASGRVRTWSGFEPGLKPWRPKIEPPAYFEQARFYLQLKSEGHGFGPAFQSVRGLWREYAQAFGLVRLPPQAGLSDGYLLHPSVLDGCFQVIRGFRDLGKTGVDERMLALPVSIERLRFFRPASEAVFSRATAVEDTPDHVIADLSIISETGEMVALIEGFRCRKVRTLKNRAALAGPALFRERWIEQPRPASDSDDSLEGRPGELWLLFGQKGWIADHLPRAVAAQDGRFLLAHPSPTFRRLGEGVFEASPDAAGLRQLFEALEEQPTRIVLSTLQPPGESGGADNIAAGQKAGTEALIALTQAVAGRAGPPRIQVVTAGATPVELAGLRPTTLQASVLGAARTIANEHPDLALRVIDIEADGALSESLITELLAPDDETEVALRAGRRYVSRVQRVAAEQLPFRRVTWDAETRRPPFRVTMTAPGVIENLVLRKAVPVAPGPQEALIEVHAVGLNFRDVMAATGLLPAEAEAEPAWQRLGFECAGIVTAVGEGADRALIGKRVVAVTSGSFASQIAVKTGLVFAIPDRFSFVEAAALPTAYVTAQYSLVTLGRICAGDRVLVHAATGGVGLAAVSIARRHGAIVYATAGSERKREYLRGQVAEVFDSRSLSFADDVLRATNGYGVDLVLNSLPGPFLEKSLSLLAPGGRFLEIGKRDIYADTPIGLRAFRKNISFFAVDLARLALERPDFLRREIEYVLGELESRQIELMPINAFPMAEVAEAFRYMAQARQIGKVVVSCEQPASIESTGSADELISPDGTYLVTGGLGGFGLAIAEWLVEQGARSLTLLGRSGASREEAELAISRMRASGAHVMAVAADVTDRARLAEVLQQAQAFGKPLRGVVHAAGVIDDCMVSNLQPERIERVFRPKVVGAWNLHELTRDLPLDFFVLLSSVAGVIGSVGQAHYAGANRALDALAAARRSEGLPALSIAWGPIADAGFLQRRQDVARYLEQTGVRPIPLKDALQGLAELIGRDCGTVVFADIDWATLARAMPSCAAGPRFSELTRFETAGGGNAGHYLRTRLLSLPAEARLPLVESFVREQVGSVLKVSPQTVEIDRPLAELGLDSLTSFELKNRIEADLGASLPIGKFLQRPTGRDLASVILDRVESPVLDIVNGHAGEAADSEPAMSIGQEALWFVERTAPGSPAYALAMCISLRPKIDPDRLDAAFQAVVARHDSLRLSFPADASGPVPALLEPGAFRLSVHDAILWDEHRLRAALDNEANRLFELAEGPLVRLHLYRRTDCDILLLHVHHIVADAASIAISVEQMLEVYFALDAALPVRWSRPMLQVADFVAWQQAMVESAAGNAHRTYWREQLADAPVSLALPVDLARPTAQRGPGAAHILEIPQALGSKLKAFARSQTTTLFAVLLSAFNVLLHRLTGEEDIVVGTPTLGRLRPEFRDAVGYFVNPVAIRTRFDGIETFTALLQRVAATVGVALEHQEYPFAKIVRELNISRDPSRSPIFQVMFAMERSAEIDSHGFSATLLNMEGAAITIRDHHIEALAVRRDRAQFDLTFVIEEFKDAIFGVIDYRTDLWHAATIEQMAAQYRSVLEAIVEAPAIPIRDLAIGQQAGQGLVGRVLQNYPDVIDAIQASAAKFPNRIAVDSDGVRLTYRQLMARSAVLAAALMARGVDQTSVVAIAIPRSVDMLAAILAVLQVGATYVPLDLSHPVDRLQRVMVDAAPDLVLTHAAAEVTAAALSGHPVLDLASLREGRTMEHGQVAVVGREASELAYIIHTSGSTGGPIGVEVRRNSLSNLLAAMALELPISCDDRLLAVTTVAFDIAGLELLLPLTVGASLVIAAEDVVRDGRRLASELAERDITIMQGTPATWRMMIDAGWSGRATLKALVGGEALSRDLAGQILSRAGELWNLYGPTETTIWSTCTQVFSQEAVPIGRPIANTTCYVVDERMQPVANGVAGELLIAGAGVARGYRNNPERTAARFVPDPFAQGQTAWCFRTGDFVRVNPEGVLEYIGRRDQQVKIRGFRVELAEVDAALSADPAVREAAAVVQGSDLAHARIIAFVSRRGGASVDEAALSGVLKRSLPAYMVPSRIAIVDALPRLPNGKVDRARLASTIIAPHATNGAAARPSNATEECLLALLKDILEAEQLNVEDDFFAVGGTSLLAMRYLARASEVLGVIIGPGDLLRAPTVASLAESINGGKLSGWLDSARSASDAARSALPAMWRPLALARAEGLFDSIDAAAIAYLPDEIAQLPGAKAQLARLEKAGPGLFWTGMCHAPFGNIALLVAPMSGRELFVDMAATRAAIGQLIDYGRRLGARCVALTGLIPAATELGAALPAPEGVNLTTGHAATAASMALTIEAAAAATGRDLREEAMCFVGLGGIGTATLHALLRCCAHPRSLTLCDVRAKRRHLESLAREIRVRHEFRGEIHITTSNGQLPEKIYCATFFVGATNVPNVIDIDRLSPGTILVDDSFPLCFDFHKAKQRFESAADILCVTGGSVALSEPLKWTLALPPGMASVAGGGIEASLFPRSTMVTGCILSSLLPAQGLPPTIGAVSPDDCSAYWSGFARLGVKAAPLHCGSWTLTTRDIYRFGSGRASVGHRMDGEKLRSRQIS